MGADRSLGEGDVPPVRSDEVTPPQFCGVRATPYVRNTTASTLTRVIGASPPVGIIPNGLGIAYAVALFAGIGLWVTAGWPAAVASFVIAGALLIAAILAAAVERLASRR